ncbi:hypothetical protein HHI36_003927 [Cryptolaemus montrouzieri]|uniref:BED-type domain-containing protein n=1 Tax=Cryptolaemus montrouzieri TaxID=559131 RepID=A0ABD2NPZ7_9CUCU
MDKFNKNAICNICKTSVSRGGTGKSASTTPLLNHLRRHHQEQYAVHLVEEKKNVSHQPTLLDLQERSIFDEEGRNEIKTDVLSECQRTNQKNSEDRTESNDETPIVLGDEINLESDEEAPLVEDFISRKPSPNLWKCLEDIKSASGSDNTGMNEDSALFTSVSQEIEAYVNIALLDEKENSLTWWSNHKVGFPTLSRLGKNT